MSHGETPAAGDVVVRMAEGHTGPAYLLRVAPGPNQLGCATLAATARLARGYAHHAGVGVWFQEPTGEFTLLVQFRKPAFDQPETPARPTWRYA